MAEKISKYRSAVMGAAILWIMIYHSGLSFSFLPLFAQTVNDFRSNGFGGVDIFLFVSGFGLYQSLSQNADPIAFYGRRLKRILPAFFPVLVIWLFLKLPAVPLTDWFRVILGNLTGTSFWIGPTPAFNWYMLALYAFYGIAPYFYRVMEKKNGIYWVLAITLLMDVCFYGNYVMIAVTRFTVFAMGMAAGRWAVQGKQIGRSFEIVSYILGVLGYILLLIFRESLTVAVLWNGGYYWYPFIFSAPAMTFALCRLFSWLEAHAHSVLRGFEVVGECSLEVYLIHVVTFEYLHISSNWIWLLTYIMMILAGYIYHDVIVEARSFFEKKGVKKKNENSCSGGGLETLYWIPADRRVLSGACKSYG